LDKSSAKVIFSSYVVKTCPALVLPLFGMALCKNSDLNMTIDYSPRNESFIKDYNSEVQKVTENFSIDTECDFSCAYGYYLIGSHKRHCLPVSKWDGLQASCKRETNYLTFFSAFSQKRSL
jgi:Sushi repeat (SCR repeat)